MAVGRVVLSCSDRQVLARVLVVLNWVSVVTGAVLVSVGVYLWAELRRWEEVMSEDILWSVPVVLVWTGLGACALNLTGARLCLDCSDLNRFLRWKLVLAPYMGVSLLLTTGVLLAAALSLGLNASGRLDAALEAGLSSAMRRYKDSDRNLELKTQLDLVQIQMSCCGKDRYQDWFRVQWVSDQYLDRTDPRVQDRFRSNVAGLYLSDSVPFSCCDPASPWPCPQTHLSSRPAPHFLSLVQSSRSLGLWGKGCREALGQHYSSILNLISLTALGVWGFEMLVVLGVRYLQTSMESLVLIGDPESDSEAWILESSLCETLRVIKSLGKCYHGNDDPNIDRPITGSGAHPTDQ
ncbi:photoreceptor outer segment membrane glycoprotein 2-like [Periophthalmus magnuspinnatus]|uniref:photoreceptor outer segment membrane glycoprotein 2-like n=1 Tax=Periophthalmus magnuspinnatus TaxID=409849 RepID=UPI0024370CCF|nr:photoreceptor outer segment membrane glycoprotein 2-like [Periophthalmus magnuspinnatus]